MDDSILIIVAVIGWIFVVLELTLILRRKIATRINAWLDRHDNYEAKRIMRGGELPNDVLADIYRARLKAKEYNELDRLL